MMGVVVVRGDEQHARRRALLAAALLSTVASLAAGGLTGCGDNVVLPPSLTNGGAGGDGGGGGTSEMASATVTAGSTGTGGAGGGPLPAPQDEGMALVQQICPQVSAESVFCVSIGPGTIEALGIDSGERCILGGYDVNGSPKSVSIAVIGEEVFWCDGYGAWHAPLVGGDAAYIGVECDGIAAFAGGLAVSHLNLLQQLAFYADADALTNGNATAVMPLVYEANGYAGYAGELWAAPQFPAAIWGYMPPSPTLLQTVVPNDSASLAVLRGLDVVDGRAILMTAFGLMMIDLTTGNSLNKVDTPPSLQGLHCWANP